MDATTSKQENAMEGQIDWQIPDVQMMLKGQKVSLHNTLRDKRGIIFGVPGAFTPVCSESHLPGFRDCMPILRTAVDLVACVAVNDPYVLKAWAKELRCPHDMVLISDWEGKFTKALGLELDASSFHMGIRCRRFCVLVEGDIIVWFGLEEDAFVDKLGLILRHLDLIDDTQLKRIQEIVNVNKRCPIEKGLEQPSPMLTRQQQQQQQQKQADEDNQLEEETDLTEKEEEPFLPTSSSSSSSASSPSSSSPLEDGAPEKMVVVPRAEPLSSASPMEAESSPSSSPPTSTSAEEEIIDDDDDDDDDDMC